MLRRAPGFDACHAVTGIPARGVAGRRHQAEDARDARSRQSCARTFWVSRPESNAESARAIFDSLFKGRTDTKTDIQQQKFGNGGISYRRGAEFQPPAGPKQNGEMLSTSFSSPASANRAYFVARNLTFAQDQQPSKADMIKEVMGKYGVPTIVGDQHLYYIYRKGSIVSVGGKYKEATALEAIDKPLDPRAAVKLNGDTVRGSCVAVVKRAQAKAKALSAMLTEAKGANCDGVLSVQLVPGTPADRVGIAQFTLLDVKRVISAAAIDSAALRSSSSRCRLAARPKL